MKIEKFRPQLKNGRILPQGGRIVFETDEPFDQIVMPIEVLDFVTQCNGEYTIAEIIENIYHQRNTIQFKLIYRTLLQLKERNFLVNGDDLEIETQMESKRNRFLSFSPLWQFYIGRRIINEGEHPFLFYFFSMCACVLAILSLQEIEPVAMSLGFFRIEHSYLYGLNFLIVGASLLLSLKNIFKAVLLLFLTGRVYNVSLTFNGFALYVRATSDSLFLVTNRLFLIVFHAATVLCYFAFVYLLHAVWPTMHYVQEAYSLALILAFSEINPFQASEVATFFKSIFNDDNLNRISEYLRHRSLLSLTSPHDRSHESGLFIALVHYAFLWAIAANVIIMKAIGYHFHPLVAALKSGLQFNSFSALGCLSMLVSFFIITSSNLYQLAQQAFFLPLNHAIQSYRRQMRSRTVTFFNTEELRATLENLPLFTYFGTEILDTILHKGKIRECLKNAPIVVEGDSSLDLFVLLSGRVETRHRLPSGALQKINTLIAPSIFGEDAILEGGRRKVEVVAVEDSIVLTLPTELLMSLAKDMQHLREITAFKNAVAVNQFFSGAPLFRDIGEDVVHLFTARGKIEDYHKDQILFKQGDLSDGFFLLLRGKVGVLVNNRSIARIQQGGFFGEISVIADVPRTATIYAMQDCQVLRIGKEAFWEILAKDLNMAMFIESVGEMRVREDVELLKNQAS